VPGDHHLEHRAGADGDVRHLCGGDGRRYRRSVVCLLSGDWIPSLPDRLLAAKPDLRSQPGRPRRPSGPSSIRRVGGSGGLRFRMASRRQPADLRAERLSRTPSVLAPRLFIGGVGWPVTGATRNGPQRASSPTDNRDAALSTGDLGRMLPSGVVEFLGRNDSQVKVRGTASARRSKRPGEGFGRSAGVVAVRGESAEERQLVAYVVPVPGCELTCAELSGGCSGIAPLHGARPLPSSPRCR
jgi:hypothetical protein